MLMGGWIGMEFVGEALGGPRGGRGSVNGGGLLFTALSRLRDEGMDGRIEGCLRLLNSRVNLWNRYVLISCYSTRF